MRASTAAFIAAAVGVVIGTAAGSFSASEPIARTPHVCLTALTEARNQITNMGDLVQQVRLRGDALDKEAFLEHDDEVVRILGEMEPVEASWASAEAECRGLAR